MAKSRRQNRKQTLNARRRVVRDKIVPLCGQSRDGFAISDGIRYSPAICSVKGLRTIKTSNFGYFFRDWMRLTKTQLISIERCKWKPRSPKSPLDYLAECAE